MYNGNIVAYVYVRSMPCVLLVQLEPAYTLCWNHQGLAKLDNIVREHVNHNVGGMFVDFSCCRQKWPN